MAAILNSAMLDSDTAILELRYLVIFSQIHSKTLFLYSDFDSNKFHLINLMMATILNSAILDSAILHKTLTQTSSIWLKLIHSDSTWWWQPFWILPSWIQPFGTKKNFTHSFWLNLMIAAILKSAILNAAILYKKNFIHSFSLNLMMAAILNSAILYSAVCTNKLHSCILTQIDVCRHLEFCYLGFSHFAQKKLHLFILT